MRVKVTPGLLPVIKAACLVEHNGEGYLALAGRFYRKEHLEKMVRMGFKSSAETTVGIACFLLPPPRRGREQ